MMHPEPDYQELAPEKRPSRRRILGFPHLRGASSSSGHSSEHDVWEGLDKSSVQVPSPLQSPRHPSKADWEAASEPEGEPAMAENNENDAAPLWWTPKGTYSRTSPHSRTPRKPTSAKAENVLSLVDGMLLWFNDLNNQYGTKLLLLLHSSQHMIKGIVHQFKAAAVMWLLREYKVSGPRMQVLLGVANSAWALKPVLGCVSDLVPVLGFRKAPYVVVTSVGGVICTTIIGLSSAESIGPLGIVACLFGMALQAATCDLLTEAKYSEQLQEKPQFGPDLIAYVWGGISVGNMIAISVVSWIIVHLGPRAVFLACIAPSAAILVPTFLNYFEEVRLSKEMANTIWANLRGQTEVIWLCVLMSGLSMLLSATGVFAKSHSTHCLAALAVMAVMLPCFHLVLRPEIAKVITFFALQASCSVSLSGATFYFYTDQPAQYSNGPHFSVTFFATALGMGSAATSLLALGIYTTRMKAWSFRSLLLFSNMLMTLTTLLDVATFLRLNLILGIPDTIFVLGSSVSSLVIRQWQWMPGIVLMSQLCPIGMEATMFALLAGCANVGTQVSDFVGAFILDYCRVHPTGEQGEDHQFDNLWKASLISTMLPIFTICILPFTIPDTKQTGSKLLLGNPASATWGSLLSRCFQES
mmetsp:Transcript_45660/g.82171  ORF Transcript_45660/g.82171 Transcript_45660/m.82171 type:complete len:641 (+) Transcript_45660:151-2073(+)|eukprot:CAMPEP_0197639840 /NCGR_PEP_ID=MMETSP1338-20131121/14331_1 /TAXON_ID=43686 ORGANISM="Pelagodinium beii, Strain RCC1491" /NCGR_SAMPLE_ID=MMETSP1338 /ASSEMBLY_ACC=CAM_ASM_000754 /LENGTH=640 /DNA_ID=CAMNT_0043212617 /DNA_START=156 /DNA_END=2078 /DNA_ORIENTATION=+